MQLTILIFYLAQTKMSQSFDWSSFTAVISIIISLIGAAFPIYTYFFKRENKQIRFVKFSPSPLVRKSRTYAEDLKIYFQDNEISEAYTVAFDIINSGNQSIDKGDFGGSVDLVFDENAKILKAEVLCTYPPELKDYAKVEVSQNTLLLKPLMINSGDEIYISTVVTFSSEVKVRGRIKGVNELAIEEYKDKSANRNTDIAFSVGMLLLLIFIQTSSSFTNLLVLTLYILLVSYIFNLIVEKDFIQKWFSKKNRR